MLQSKQKNVLNGNSLKNHSFSLDQLTKDISELQLESHHLNSQDLCHNLILSSKKVLPTDEETMTETNVYVTKERKDFICRMINILNKSANNLPCTKQHILTGCSGIGKSFTLFLMVEQFKKNKDLKVVFIPNCYHIMKRGWDPIIEEFMFTFPDDKQELQKLLSKNSINNADSESEIIPTLREVLYKSLKRKEIPIFVLDQIDFILDSIVYSMFGNLTIFPWKLQVFSQPTNNEIQKQFKFFRIHEFDNMISIEDTRKLIASHEMFKQLKGTKDDLENIINLVGTTPREIDTFFGFSGDNIAIKTENYKIFRKNEIMKTHMKFWEKISPYALSELFQAIYLMDRNISLRRDIRIDNELMRKNYSIPELEYKIESSFPFAGKILKEMFEGEAYMKNNETIFSERIQFLNLLIKDTSLTDSTQGGLYEEIVHNSFQRAKRDKSQVNLTGHPLKYLNFRSSSTELEVYIKIKV